MLGNLFKKINENISNYYKKIVPFFSVIFYILFLCFFHNAYFTIALIIPSIFLITKKFQDNKYFKESDLLVIVFAITMAFIMEFIIFYFSEVNVITGISISLLTTLFISLIIILFSFICALIFKPLFKYLNLY